jgi:DNA topoisomerase VI subunit B
VRHAGPAHFWSAEGKKPQARLNRATFRTSRLLDFCSRKELIAQTGHQPEEWPLVAGKEPIDNALDACEDERTPPVLSVAVDDEGLTVTDNGPGVLEETVEDILDYGFRVSSREAYVSPCRGAQGNALKCVLAMPFVLDGSRGRVDITAKGVRHSITFGVDRIRQEPVIDHRKDSGPGGRGTRICVRWPDSARSILDSAKAQLLQIADDYCFLNPHLTLNVGWRGERTSTPAAVPSWAKWLPGHPTSAHWYNLERLSRLVAASVAHDADRGQGRTLRQFVAEFDGFVGSAKQARVLEEVGLTRAPLSALVAGNAVDPATTGKLLAAMQRHSKPVRPKRLGAIGKEHLRQRFEALGCQPESFNYKPTSGESDGAPWVLETAFGYRPKAQGRRLILGVNWSPAIGDPFRQLGACGPSLGGLLEKLLAGGNDPIVLLLHLACPRVEYRDRRKSSLVVADGPADNEEE